ncbi:alpha/beta hydrolase family protein [Bacillus sp. REN16]|uniref:alpha/beta hydrolase family protein n=1 Tax=Bacillus sp. REN16 TaxID=2887296 RepID=UPI001E567E12|nr:prolyl oligopeptidase family serine peptidase [Bacillus sp. REN16]MCC3357172.1 prolyl oligopeptidase family serine peptidase [Bacillus sp. REN16]
MVYKLDSLNQIGIPPLLDEIDSFKKWEEKRDVIYQTWLEFIGELPPCEGSEFEIISFKKEKDHYRIKMKYLTAFNDFVSAYLLIPLDHKLEDSLDNIKSFLLQKNVSKEKKLPAVLALHPTSSDGKDDISLNSGRDGRRYGLELVQRGYIVLAPDTITAGDRIDDGSKPFFTAPFYKQYPDWSAVAKMLVDHIYGVNVLSEIGFVNREKIGVIGHSLGGYNGYFLAGVDNRIKAVVCSCGFSTFTNDPETHRWGKREWFSHIPKLSDLIMDGEVPFEFHEIAALVAPTPFFLWMGQSDHIFPHWEPAAKGVEELTYLYKWLGEENNFTSYIGNGGHDFPAEIRNLAYSFLERYLL